MALIRARFLSLDLIVVHGAALMSVRANIASFAAVYSSQRSSDSRSMGDSFQRPTGSICQPQSGPSGDDDALRVSEAESDLAGQFVWVHCCQNIDDPEGELEDEQGRSYHQVFDAIMFCTEFISFDDVARQCDENFGEGQWDEYQLFPAGSGWTIFVGATRQNAHLKWAFAASEDR